MRARRPSKLPWRRWNHALHRDLGYLVAALTLIYAISGVAVNHTHQWNPNYRFERQEWRFEPMPLMDKEALTAALIARLELPPPQSAFRATPHQIELFYEGYSVKADTREGRAEMERPRPRPLLSRLNALHLNHPKGAWTWFADAYAVCLAFLAISGLLMARGRRGFMGRGKYFFAAGLAVPIVFMLL
ncbi:PepSY-associated TM helix domain-containing protein [Myxococcota bacterium]|nr:PepSY-associated TM helix domain-containing protein [Myxococcota bacterium]MBU1429691.1 PepSY-associated TM helix domain-containing protein [Myxococcota bacterium]MBU1898616.1 PepSY-associated TM helix domain-containing protein [Myxococcota bacterium]